MSEKQVKDESVEAARNRINNDQQQKELAGRMKNLSQMMAQLQTNLEGVAAVASKVANESARHEHIAALNAADSAIISSLKELGENTNKTILLLNDRVVSTQGAVKTLEERLKLSDTRHDRMEDSLQRGSLKTILEGLHAGLTSKEESVQTAACEQGRGLKQVLREVDNIDKPLVTKGVEAIWDSNWTAIPAGVGLAVGTGFGLYKAGEFLVDLWQTAMGTAEIIG